MLVYLFMKTLMTDAQLPSFNCYILCIQIARQLFRICSFMRATFPRIPMGGVISKQTSEYTEWSTLNSLSTIRLREQEGPRKIWFGPVPRQKKNRGSFRNRVTACKLRQLLAFISSLSPWFTCTCFAICFLLPKLSPGSREKCLQGFIQQVMFGKIFTVHSLTNNSASDTV